MPKAFDCTPQTSKQVANFYFTALGGDRFECKCGNKLMQKLSAGYNNLLVHVFSQHPDFKEEIRRRDNQSRLSKCYSEKATNIYKCIQGPTCYLEWIKPTSNIVERLKSRAKLVFGTSRHRLSPRSLKENLFLYVNKRFWDNSVVDKNNYAWLIVLIHSNTQKKFSQSIR